MKNNKPELLYLTTARGFALVFQFATQIVLGAFAGASALGALHVFTTWSMLAAEISTRGLPTAAMKHISVAHPLNQFQFIRDLLRLFLIQIFRITSAIVPSMLVLFVASVYFVESNDSLLPVMAVGLIGAAPALAITRLYSESLKAMNDSLFAISVENFVTPACILTTCGLYYVLELTPSTVALVTSVCTAALICVAVLRRRLLTHLPVGKSTSGNTLLSEKDSRETLHFWGNGLLSVCFLQMPFLLMPLYAPIEEIGVFSLAFKMVNIITTLLLLLSALYSPMMARAATSADPVQLRALLRKSQFLSISIFFPLVAVLYLSTGYLTNYFGPEFSSLGHFVLLLSIGHSINAATGLSGVLLNMSGCASQETSASLFALVVGVLLSLMAGPRYGIEGLILCYAAAMCLKNLLSYGLAECRLYCMSRPPHSSSA